MLNFDPVLLENFEKDFLFFFLTSPQHVCIWAMLLLL